MAQHTPEAIRRRLQGGPRHSYLRDFVYGAIDGSVTTFAMVAGVAGAQLGAGMVVLFGLVNLLADGMSMAASNYLGTRAELQARERLRRIEHEHIEKYPAGEREEVRQIYRAKGFGGEDLDRAVEVITSDTDRWVETMLADEHGVPPVGPSPARAAAATFFAFLVIGALPLLAFVYQLAAPASIRLSRPFLLSAAMTAGAFFIVGALKGRFVGHRWWASGLETLTIGGAAAAVGFAVGALLRGFVGVG